MNISKIKPKINRRRLLTNSALVAVGAAVPVAAMKATHPSPIMVLFKEWRQIRSDSHGVSEDECSRCCDRMSAIEAELMPLPITDAADLSAKLIVHTADFDFVSSGEHAPEFQRQVRAYAMAGIEPRLKYEGSV